MKKNKRSILDAEVKQVWDKLLEVFDEHGAQNTFVAMLTGIRDTKYMDLDMNDLIDTLFKRDKSYQYHLFLESDTIKQIANETASFGYELVKIESLPQQYKFEAFMQDMQDNPYQLNLI